MSFADRSFKLSPLPLILIFSLLQFGCDDDGTGPENFSYPTTAEFWQGTYESLDHTQNGGLLLDLTRTGSVVKGQIVLRDRGEAGSWHFFDLSGTSDGDSLHLALDYDSHPYLFTFALAGEVSSDSTSFSGTISLPTAGLEAAIQAERQQLGELVLDSNREVPNDIKGLAVMGDHLWISTLGYGYFTMPLTADAFDDTVLVLLENDAFWTSNDLAASSSELWGTLPTSITDGTGTRNEADLIRFTPDGTITQRVGIPMRSSGLSYDGSSVWNLGPGSEALYRLDASGSVVETVPISVCDLICLEYDGTYFWSVGWFLSNLYQIDRTGKTVAVYHLPDEVNGPFPEGLAFDGAKFWYAAQSYVSLPGSQLSTFHVVGLE
ncbi:MAG TPA: hypothetical protein VKA63_11090 [Candidatus Krumholzibacteria bacterium]|nr:hypothetical protein [Candidatus Krumholzibacteria bacterium]